MLRSISKSKIFKPAFQSRTLASISHDLNDAYDVVIIGGGVAGATLACSLGKYRTHTQKELTSTNFYFIASRPSFRHNRIALVEGMDLTSVKNWEPKSDNFSNRVVSLTPGSMDFFNSKFCCQTHRGFMKH